MYAGLLRSQFIIADIVSTISADILSTISVDIVSTISADIVSTISTIYYLRYLPI